MSPKQMYRPTSLIEECRERGIEAFRPDGGLTDAAKRVSDERVARKDRELQRSAYDYGVEVERLGLHAVKTRECSLETAEKGGVVPPHLRKFYDAGREAVKASRRGEHPRSFDDCFQEGSA